MGWLDFFKDKIVKEEKTPFVPFSVVSTEKGDYEEFEEKMLKYSLIMLINGKRGSGKTALGMKMLEMFNKKTKRKCYVMGYENTKLPRWMKKVDDIEKIPNNAVTLIDEGAVSFFSRDSMKKSHKDLSKLMAIARHKNLVLILITQNSGMIDLNVMRLADTVFLKEPSLMQAKFERKAVKDMYEKAALHFKEEKKKRFYVYDDDFEGVLKHDLPGFWSDDVSTSFKNF